MHHADNIMIFLKVAEHGSFTAAAKLMRIPVATISRRIADLEQNLGSQLLKRTTRKVSLTTSGQMLYNQCHNIPALIEDALGALSDIKIGVHGKIRISTTAAFSQIFLNNCILDFVQNYPQVNCEILTSNQHTNHIQDNIDIGFRIGEISDNSLTMRKICDLEFAFLASPQYIAQYGTPTENDHVSEHIGITFKNRHYSIPWQVYSKGVATTITPQHKLFYNSMLDMKHAVLQGAGISYLPIDLFRTEIQNNEVIHLLSDKKTLSNPVHLIYLTDRYQSETLRTFIDHCIRKSNAFFK